ncbi:MAG TPA: sugar ABC transporter permease [Chloroflexota bacterium]|nr:sugar ABC transporter permease [Chloroflexota bacterium]
MVGRAIAPLERPRGLGPALRRAVQRPQFWFGLAVLGPIAVWYCVFAFAPILRAFYMAVVDYQLLDPASSKFVGTKHFAKLLEYELFWIALRNTLVYALGFLVAMVPLALLVASLLARVIRGRNLYLFFIFLPVVVSLVAISLLFKYLLDAEVGPFNQILGALGLPRSRFLTSVDSVLPTVIGVDVWKSLGFYVVILLAGMLTIPEHLYDAARVDGANAWQRFRNITLPLLGHTLTLVSILIVLHGLSVYTIVVVMPEPPGGPGRAAYVMNLLVFEEAFSRLNFGLATAIALALFLIVLAITVIQLRLLRPRWSY